MGTKNAQGKPHGAYVLCRSKFLELQTKYLNFVCFKYSSFTNKDIFAEMHLTCEIFGGWYSDKKPSHILACIFQSTSKHKTGAAKHVSLEINPESGKNTRLWLKHALFSYL